MAATFPVVGQKANQTSANLTRRVFRQGPFAPRPLPRFYATMGLSDSRLEPRPRLLIPASACRLARHPDGSPKFPDCSFRARCLLSPRRVPPVLSIIPSRRMLASPHLAGWPLSFCVTRPNRVRLRCGSRVRLPRLRRRDYSRSPLGRLPVQRSIHRADSFHSARTAELCLAHRIARMTRMRRGRRSGRGGRDRRIDSLSP